MSELLGEVEPHHGAGEAVRAEEHGAPVHHQGFDAGGPELELGYDPPHPAAAVRSAGGEPDDRLALDVRRDGHDPWNRPDALEYRVREVEGGSFDREHHELGVHGLDRVADEAFEALQDAHDDEEGGHSERDSGNAHHSRKGECAPLGVPPEVSPCQLPGKRMHISELLRPNIASKESIASNAPGPCPVQPPSLVSESRRGKA